MASESRHTFIFTDVEELDITDADAVGRIVKSETPQLLINCAAYTDVERAEDDKPTAQRLNATAPAILAEAMQGIGGAMIHISTDYVFGAAPLNTPAVEDTPAAPAGVYGRTKLEGELAVERLCKRHIIIRTAWLYSEYGRNFMLTMRRLTSTLERVKVVFDQTGTPTYARDLARAILVVADALADGRDDCYGIYHFSDEGVCSWFDFATAIAREFGNTACRVEPCRSADFPSKVKRPPYSVLDKAKIKNNFGIEPPYWQDALRECTHRLTE